MSLITISSLTQPWSYGGAEATLKVYVSEPYHTDDFTFVKAGKVGSDNLAYDETSCAVDGGYIEIPTVIVHSTTDSRDRPDVRLTAVLYDSDGNERRVLLDQCPIPSSPTTTTWEDLYTTQNTTRPSIPTDVEVADLSSSVTASWSESEMPVGSPYTVTGYEVQIGSSIWDVGDTLSASIPASLSDELRVRARSSRPNFSLWSLPGVPEPPEVPTGLALEVLGQTSILATWDAPPDTEAPTVPVMTAATGVTDTEINWNWNASTDNTAVTGYDLQVALDSGFTTGLVTFNLGNVLTYEHTGLDPETTYYARARAHDAVPNNSDYSSSVNATTEVHVWSPADLGADLFAWYEPNLETGYANNDLMATATDQGPNGNDGTSSGANRPTYKTGIANGHAVARFDHTFQQHFVLPDPSALTEANVFIVVKATLADGSYGLWKIGGTADETLYGFATTAIYDIFGATVRKGPFTISSVTDDFHIYSVRAVTSDWENFLDDVSLGAADVTNVVDFDSTAYLGASALGSPDSLDGDVAAFIMTSRDLTGPEWDDMINYLRTKFDTP